MRIALLMLFGFVVLVGWGLFIVLLTYAIDFICGNDNENE